MKKLTLSTDTLFYATRYAVARNTGAALAVVNDIKKSAKRLEECDRIQLLKEIKEALARNGIEQSNRHDWEQAISYLAGAAPTQGDGKTPTQGDGKTPEQIELEALGMEVDRIGGSFPFEIEARIHGGGYLHFRARSRGGSWWLSLAKTHHAYWDDKESIELWSETRVQTVEPPLEPEPMPEDEAVAIIRRLWPNIKAAQEGEAV